jgi:hypothetical protein
MIDPSKEAGERNTTSAKILTFSKAHEATERSVDAHIAELKAVLNESVRLALRLGTDARWAALPAWRRRSVQASPPPSLLNAR